MGNVQGVQVVRLIMPASWAGFLFYGDAEGLERAEIKQILRTLSSHKARGPAMDATPEGFRWHHDASWFGVGGAECMEYVLESL